MAIIIDEVVASIGSTSATISSAEFQNVVPLGTTMVSSGFKGIRAGKPFLEYFSISILVT
jgi:hypothetical protein